MVVHWLVNQVRIEKPEQDRGQRRSLGEAGVF
jgi:hypothetical protein